MTPTINLLPWREWRRRRRNALLLLQFGGVLAAALAVVGAAGMILHWTVEAQQARNASLREEVGSLNERLAEVHRLGQRRDALLERIRGVQALEVDRAAIVRLFDELADALPKETHYQALELRGEVLSLTGVAAANGGVAALLRNLNRSAWFEQANLVRIEEAPEGAAYGAGAGVFHLTAVRAGACLTEGAAAKFQAGERCG